MLRRIATFSVRHRGLVIVAWLLLVAGATLAGREYGGDFSNDLSLEGTDSQAAYEAMAGKFPEMAGDGLQVVVHADEGVTTERVRTEVEASLDAVRDQPGVVSVQSPYGPGPAMVSDDKTTAVATVRFADRAAELDPATIEAVQDAFVPVEGGGVVVEFGGAALGGESGPSGSEAIGLAAAVLVLLFAFGSVFAMAVPLVTAVLALGLGIGVIELLADHTAIGTAGPVVAAMIGLGVGIDYALLVVTRHREGLAAGHPASESIPVALDTAGRSVLVAGTTVIIAILSLYLIGIPFVATLGLASAITVTSTLMAAVTLLPALLAVFGERLDRFRVRRTRLDHGAGHVGRWHRWTRHVQRRPWPYLVVSVVLLAVMAIPLFDLRLGTADDGSAPVGSTERIAFDLIDESFGPGWTGPLVVTAEAAQAGGVAEEADRLRADLSATDGVASVPPPVVNDAGDTAVLTVVPTTSPDDPATEELVHRVREEVLADTAAVETHLGGPTATSIDLADRLEDRMVWFMAFVVGLSLLLLLVEFRSLFVPVKAAIMNLLSVGAAYGAVVAVFQWGWLADWVGAEPGPIESFAPMMLFAVLFGLSMDYEVFLLSRVREEYRRTGAAGAAVVDGIAATARVITAAAAVMVVVFGSFLLNDERVVNLFGFGLAVAIAIDATLVRLVLVPAVMAIAGRHAWYLPRGLRRILARTERDRAVAKEPSSSATTEPVSPDVLTEDHLRHWSTRTDTGVTDNKADGAGMADHARDGSLADADLALAVLRRVVDEGAADRRRYERTRAELLDLRSRHEDLVAALRTLRQATDTVDRVRRE